MLNTDFINELYAALTKADKQKLRTRLFGDSKQSMAYFNRTKDITMSKLEVMADFFHVPLDALRADSEFTFLVHARKIMPQDKSQVSNVEAETEALKAKIAFLEQALALKQEKVEVLQMKVDVYKQIEENRALLQSSSVQ